MAEEEDSRRVTLASKLRAGNNVTASSMNEEDVADGDYTMEKIYMHDRVRSLPYVHGILVWRRNHE